MFVEGVGGGSFVCVCLFFFYKIFGGVANSADPDQTAPSGAVWSGSALFAYAISGKFAYKILGQFT